MTHEQVYLIVSIVVIASFIAYQAWHFNYDWSAYIGLVLSFSGALFALINTL